MRRERHIGDHGLPTAPSPLLAPITTNQQIHPTCLQTAFAAGPTIISSSVMTRHTMYSTSSSQQHLCCCFLQVSLALQEPEHEPGLVRLAGSSGQAPQAHSQLLGAQGRQHGTAGGQVTGQPFIRDLRHSRDHSRAQCNTMWMLFNVTGNEGPAHVARSTGSLQQPLLLNVSPDRKLGGV